MYDPLLCGFFSGTKREDTTINMQNWVDNTQNGCEKFEHKNFNTLTSFPAFAEKEILNKCARKKIIL